MNREITESQGNWKPKVMVFGAVLGAAVGVAATYLLIQRYGDERPPQINAAEGVKIGVLVAGLLRSIATL